MPAWTQPTLVQDLRPGPEGSDPTWPTTFDGRVYFWADDGAHGRELWATDGLTTTLVADLFPGPEGAQLSPTIPRFLGTLGGRLYFRHRESPASEQLAFVLWATDGDSTAVVSTVLPSSYLGDPVRHHAIFKEKLYFSGYEPAHGTELWATDGDTTALVADLFPYDREPGGSFPNEFTVTGDKLYFFAHDVEYGMALWTTDGDTTARVTDFSRVVSTTMAVSAFFDGMLYFQGNGELWRSDGSATEFVADIRPGPAHSLPQHFFVALGRLFFVANDGRHGVELWTTDGEVTELVADLSPGPARGAGYDFTVFDDKLYFFAKDESHGIELWVWDDMNVAMVADICPGCQDARPGGLTVFDGALYFAADDGVYGQELWRSDGRSVERVADLRPGPSGSAPEAFTVLDDLLFFTADDGVHGRELWVLTANQATANQQKAEAVPPSTLTSIYPNPFHDRAVFTLSVARRQPVRIALYDVLGRRLALLYDGLLQARTPHTFTLKGRSLPNGTYFVHITGETFTETRLTTLLK